MVKRSRGGWEIPPFPAEVDALADATAARDRLAAENARLREALARARVRIREHLDMGLETRCPDDCDPEHDFEELLTDLDDALLEHSDA